jgi:excisionase family DNA binding protein
LTLTIELTAAQMDALADRVAAVLAERFEQPETPSAWLNADQAAEYMATTRGRLYDLVQLGKLNPRRDGRRLVFRRDDLDDYLEAAA